jgi:mono/diheme cytochrome c family protein
VERRRHRRLRRRHGLEQRHQDRHHGNRQSTIDVGEGPSGLALDVPRNRLYCLNRFEGTVSVINTTNDTETGRVSFYDPTPQVIKDGRPFFYDAHLTSQLGNGACAGCHIDGHMDTEAWDLGDPAGAMKTLDEPCNSGVPFAGSCGNWHPMKGPMMTQSLIGSVGTEPLHWRGDREDMNAFTVGFTGLLGANAPPTTAEMDELEAFIATIRFSAESVPDVRRRRAGDRSRLLGRSRER